MYFSIYGGLLNLLLFHSKLNKTKSYTLTFVHKCLKKALEHAPIKVACLVLFFGGQAVKDDLVQLLA